MTNYLIFGREIHSEASQLAAVLAQAYEAKVRPVCMCRTPGPQMYISKVEGRYLIKRMPNSGIAHSPDCDSYEPPPNISGLGQLMGSAIKADADEGTTALKLAFALTKGSGRAAPTPSDSTPTSAKTDGNKLSLRSALHYLWDQAGFTRWSPSMHGKRNWFVIRKYLALAAQDKTTKGLVLGDVLYVPEVFSVEHKEDIARRRIALMARVAAQAKGAQNLMLVIGEVKEISPSRYGHKFVLKHLPDCHFMLPADLHKRLVKAFAVELALWDALETCHLVVVGTFGLDGTGVASMVEVAVMCVNENWIPFESTYEKMLLDDLTQQQRRFLKSLRYNLPSTSPIACAVLTDTEPQPTALYIVPPGASEEYAQAVDELTQESDLAVWVWNAGDPTRLALPAPGQRGLQA